MGDRGNVAVMQYPYDDQDKVVYLYTHWGGTELPVVLAEALDSAAGRGRWNDPAYLARIIFCRMVRGDEAGETGYGISLTPPDNEHEILYVNCGDGTVNGVPFEKFIDYWRARKR